MCLERFLSRGGGLVAATPDQCLLNMDLKGVLPVHYSRTVVLVRLQCLLVCSGMFWSSLVEPPPAGLSPTSTSDTSGKPARFWDRPDSLLLRNRQTCTYRDNNGAREGNPHTRTPTHKPPKPPKP